MSKRNTSQRRAIRAVFEGTDRPLSTEEVLEVAQSHKPGLGIATVYRTLKLLIEEGWLKTVVLPGMPPRYERAGKVPHHHFYCRSCGRAYEIPCSETMLDSIVPPGFSVTGHDLVIYGSCSSCGPEPMSQGDGSDENLQATTPD
jgi:Fur family ferric uptake transcriptional regulator